MTEWIPSSEAIAQACCPPAPPNDARLCSLRWKEKGDVSWVEYEKDVGGKERVRRGRKVGARRQETLRLSKLTNRLGHRLVRHRKESLSRLEGSVGGARLLVDLFREPLELLLDDFEVERLVLVRTEDLGEGVDVDTAEEKVRVGNCEGRR